MLNQLKNIYDILIRRELNRIKLNQLFKKRTRYFHHIFKA